MGGLDSNLKKKKKKCGHIFQFLSVFILTSQKQKILQRRVMFLNLFSDSSSGAARVNVVVTGKKK